MNFRTGMMVRVKRRVICEAGLGHIRGITTTIVAGPHYERGEDGRWWVIDEKDACGVDVIVAEQFLVPIDDGFKRFLEKTLRPLKEPLAA